MLKICKECGKEFEAKRSSTFLCSSECSRQRRSTLSRENARFVQLKRKMNTCNQCGKKFMAKRTDVLTCSDKCRYRRINTLLREKAWLKRNMDIKECVVCKKEFESKVYNAKSCSPKCKEIWASDMQKMRKNRPRITITCVECRKEFEPKIYNAKLCSPKCRRRWEINRERKRSIINCIAKQCGINPADVTQDYVSVKLLVLEAKQALRNNKKENNNG